MGYVHSFEQHNLHLITVAVVLCLLASYTAYSLIARGVQSTPRTRPWWIVAGAVATGSGVWATHFVAILAFIPPVPVGYEEIPTLLSILAAIVISGIGLGVSTSRIIGMPLLGGTVIGAGIGAMHYIGMSAWRFQGVMEYDLGYVIASLVIGIVLAGIATSIGLAKLDTAHRLTAAVLLTVAICAMHFTGMAGMSLRLDSSVALPDNALPPLSLAIAVSAVALLVLGLSLGGVLFDQRETARALREGKRLQVSEARFRQLADATFEGILIHKRGKIVDANVVISELVGVPVDQLIGRTVADCVAEGSRPILLKHMEMNIETPCEVLFLQADGTSIQAEILTRTVAPLPSADGPLTADTHKVLAIRDIRERKQAEADIRHMAHHDALTGLANRRMFIDRLQQELARSKRDGTTVSVLCLDLDRFKQVNDFGGHRSGDEVLKQVARRLTDAVRKEDTVARLSGDEFAVVQVGVHHPDGPAILAERLVKEIAQPFELDGQQTMIGTSIGIALHPGNGDEGEDLVRAADTALYRAKEAGRGTFRFFEAEMDARLQERREMEHDLRQALAKEELHVHYQPLVDCSTGRVLGFEALVRWNHPIRGSIPPLRFIPLAEECGLIMPLGAWVMRKACIDAATWPADKLVAVNLSPAQFRHADLAREILKILKETGLPAARLEIEITESLLIDDPDRVLRTLLALKEAGVRISLDDFGTGYSSLSYLQRFPFDKIKIDRSFVSQMEDNPDSMSIVRAVIALGKSLRIKITAEGVETREQLDLLQKENCDLVQGYLLGRPMAKESLGRLLAAKSLSPGSPQQVA